MIKKLLQNRKIKFVLFAIFFFISGVIATNAYNSVEIKYSPSDTSWSVSNVNDALNDLYSIKTKLVNLQGIGTANASNILVGTSAAVKGTKVDGTMKNNGDLNWNPSTSTSKTLSAGYYSGGTISTSNAYNAGLEAGKVYERDPYYLYNVGNTYSSITGGWTRSYSYDFSTLTLNSSYMTFTAGNSNYENCVSTVNKIDFTGYSRVYLEVDNITGLNLGLMDLYSTTSVQRMDYGHSYIAMYAYQRYTKLANGHYLTYLDVKGFPAAYVVFGIYVQTVNIYSVYLR